MANFVIGKCKANALHRRLAEFSGMRSNGKTALVQFTRLSLTSGDVLVDLSPRCSLWSEGATIHAFFSPRQ
jgi:hypothetical protein